METTSIGGAKEKWDRDQCHGISTIILDVLRNHTLSKPNEDNTSYFDDKFHYFKVYWAPAFEGRQYQQHMNEFEYASYMLDIIFDTKELEGDWLSVFNGNPTTLALAPE